MEIQWPSTEKIDKFRPEITAILNCVADYKGEGWDGIRTAYVSDKTHIDHFFVGEPEERFEPDIQTVFDRLGLELNDILTDGLLITMAKRLRNDR